MITLIIKTTNGCNLRCSYCSVPDKKENYSFIDIETIKAAGKYVGGIARARNEKEVKVILHGGEPTILPVNIYKDFFCYLQKVFLDIHWSFSIQTNGYYLSDDYIELFDKFGMKVGISVDGCRSVQNSLRKNKEGKNTFDKVKVNILRLLDAQIHVSALAVLTKPLLHENLEWINFFNYYGINLKLNPLLNYGEAKKKNELWLSEGDYADYMISVFKFMLEYDIEIRITPVSDFFDAIISGGKIKECVYRQDCMGDFYCVDYNGDVYPCGRFSDMHRNCIGNVDLLIKEKSLSKTYTTLSDDCTKCTYLKYCYGGCVAYRDEKTKKTPLCEDNKRIINYFRHDGIDDYVAYLKERRDFLREIENSDVKGDNNV